MKLHLILLAALAAAPALAADQAATNVPPTEVETPAETVQPALPTEVETPVAPAATSAIATDANSDEIDLEELDDSADAAATPKIRKSAEKESATLVDISCDNATLADILRQFRKVTDANIISDDSTNLQRRVSVNLHHVPWLDGLQSILNLRQYRLEERGDIYFVREDKVAEPVITRTFSLKHASAKELTDLFNKSYGKKDAKGTVILPIATCFEGANVVVVTATEKTIADCETIVRSVDRAVPQVYIEARFLELSSEAMHKLGMQWNSLESWGVSTKDIRANFSGSVTHASDDSRSLVQAQTGNISRNISSTSAIVSSSSSDDETASGKYDATRSSSKNTNNDFGFSGSLSADDFRLALSAFESLGEGKIFSNPKVIVSNGKEATVDMTTKYPNVKLTSQRNNSDYGSYLDMSAELQEIPGEKGHKEFGYRDKSLFSGSCFYEWGICLSVKPRISPDGLISVEIVPTISQLNRDPSSGGSTTGFYEVASDTSFGLFPIIEMKRIFTEFTMKDGSTAVIGGLTQTVEDDVDSGIPFLRHLPWIGPKLFGWKSRQKVQKEIIVCVTLGIANPAELPQDIGLPKNAVIGREYLNGNRLEPGDRKGGVEKALQLDLRQLDDEDRRQEGKVTITPAE